MSSHAAVVGATGAVGTPLVQASRTAASALPESPHCRPHLRQIFTKLGIASRAALRDTDLTG
jgi:hypothetical protein